MRIALVVSGGLHPSGRVQVTPSLLALLQRISGLHEVHAFALRHLPDAATYTLAGARVHDLGRPRGRWRQFRALMRGLRDTGPFDVLHGYMADPAGLLAAVAARRLGVPCLVTCDSGEFVAIGDLEYGLQRSLRHRLLVRYACRYASAVHVTSEYMAQLARACGVDATCVPLGIDLTPFERIAPALEGPPWTVVQVASINRIKDHVTLLRAVARVRRAHDVRLHLAGEDTLAGEVQRTAHAIGVGDAVTFHGFVPHDRLPELFRRAHLYAQSSRHEAAGVAVLEAAAAALPIVGTRVGYVSDWSGTVESVTPGDADALAAAIATLIEDPARRRTLGAAARARVQRYDANRTAAEMLQVYSTLSRHDRVGPARG
jgi:glycosyltransferase involved in cell wall biosynthesis